MAYQARRHQQFEEDLELLDQDGMTAHIIHVKLDADDVIVKLNRKYTALTRTLTETTALRQKAQTNEEIEECFRTLGSAVTDLFEAVFGDDDAKTVIDFYEGRYIEMIKEIVPFITECVIPRCIEIKKENEQSILKSYNRKQRRAMFKRVR